MCTPGPLTKAEKGLVVSILARIRTAIDAKFAAADPAVGLLALSGKCAAIDSTLNGMAKRCPTGAQRLRVMLIGVLDMWANIKSVMR